MHRPTQWLIALILVALGCARETASPGTTRIGLVTGLTGPTAAWGEAIRRGAQLAIEDCNASDARFELVVEDDQGKPETTAAVVEMLITRAGVAAIVGADTSGRTLAAAPICERAGVTLVSPTASAPAVTRRGRFTFRVCATDDLEAATAARLAWDRLRAQQAVILRDTKNDYSTGMAATFADVFTKSGGRVETLDYSEGDADFRAQLTAAGALRPDVLFVPGYYGDVAQIASQARDLGLKVPMLGGSGWDSPKLLEIGGPAVEGSWFVSGMRSALPRFVEEFRRRHATPPDAASAQAYDAVAVLCSAVRRGGSDRTRIRDAVAATRDFPGASGTITMGADNNVQKPLAVFRITGGQFVEQ